MKWYLKRGKNMSKDNRLTIIKMIKRNLNNLKMSKDDKTKTYWYNVLHYDLERLEKLIK